MEDQPVAKAPPSNASSPIPPTVTQSSSHSLPPSPPSSCGSQSPPLQKPLQESRLSPTPADNKGLPPKPFLPFSIENILRPDFGSTDKIPPPPIFSPLSPEIVLRTPPKTPELSRHEDIPVDLSHKKPFISITSTLLSKNAPRTLPRLHSPKPSIPSSTAPSKPSTNTSEGSSRVKYPDNPEELANPKVPAEEMVWPAWVYCTRYSDRPSSGPRSRRMKKQERNTEEKRPRTAFTSDQLARLKIEFETNKYLTEKRRQDLARELGLNESQIKIWFQNKRAKIKKVTGPKNGLAHHLMAQGLYNHSTMAVDEDDLYLN